MFQLQCRRHLTVLHPYLAVVLIHHMQHHAVVGRILRVAVEVPVRRTDVQLYISSPFHITYTNPRVEEVRTGVSVEFSRTQYGNRLAICRGQPAVEHLVLPHVLQERLSHQLNISFILSKKPLSCFVGFGLKLSCLSSSSSIFFSSLERFLGTHTLRHTSRSPRP